MSVRSREIFKRPGSGLKRAQVKTILLVASTAGFAVLAASAIGVFIPTLPREVVMATGPSGGAYAQLGERYKPIFARQGIRLVVLNTAGSIENLAKLRDPHSGVTVGFLQGGVTRADEAPELRSLGTMFYEPLWIFSRCKRAPTNGMGGLRGKRLAVGPEGSGLRDLALKLLTLHDIDQRNTALLPLGPSDATAGLLAGTIDAAMIVGGWASPTVQKLLHSRDICAVSLTYSSAYPVLYPFLSKLTLAAGVADLVSDLPPRDVALVAPKASLVVSRDLPPAIQYLLLDAATEIHSGIGAFSKAGEFPAAEAVDLPLSETARRFYTSGRPFLQRYLPLRLAVLAEQLLLIAIPLFGVAYPLLRFTPQLYNWGMRRRIYRLYGELKLLELRLDGHHDSGDGAADLRAALDSLESRASHLRVPLGYAHMLYTLRHHLDLVRGRVGRPEPG